jgi:hypothetical protein
MTSIEFLGMTFDFVGTIILAIAVLRVHMKLGKEHKIDKKVLQAIHREKIFAILAIIFIFFGFILQVFGGSW